MGLFSRTLSRLDELKKSLTRDPSSRHFLALADEYRKQGQPQLAIETLRQGLAQDPSAVAGHVALGRLLQHAGQLDEALSCFQAALKLDPQNLVAIRQSADAHLARGEKIEAIKRLKLFRGLSPGDREVNEIIRQLDAELAATVGPRKEAEAAPVPAGVPAPLPEPPAIPLITTAPLPPRLPDVPPLPQADPAPDRLASSDSEDETLPADAAPVPAEPAGLPREEGEAEPPFAGEVFPDEAEAHAEPFSTEPLVAPTFAPPSPETAPPPLPDSHAPFEEEPFGARPEAAPETAPPVPGTVAAPAAGPAPGPPAVTETLAELLLAQGHFGEATDAFRALAAAEREPERAAGFRARAEELEARGAQTPRGRLEAWAGPFVLARGRRETDLVAVVEETVRRLGPSAAVLTDFEGVPLVGAGPRSEAEAMESLAAELTAFWKHVRRSRSEVGEGNLDSLVLSGSAGTAAVQLVTPAYALLLKAGAGVATGRIRFEAARAAEQLRPALL